MTQPDLYEQLGDYGMSLLLPAGMTAMGRKSRFAWKVLECLAPAGRG